MRMESEAMEGWESWGYFRQAPIVSELYILFHYPSSLLHL